MYVHVFMNYHVKLLTSYEEIGSNWITLVLSTRALILHCYRTLLAFACNVL